MEKGVLRFLKLDDEDASNVEIPLHEDPHELLKTHRSLRDAHTTLTRDARMKAAFGTYAEPVSKMMSNEVAGVPMAREP
jgi:hypothetical protein